MKRIVLLTAILTMAWVSVCHSQMSGSSSSPSSSDSSAGVSSGSSGSSSGDFGATSNPSSSGSSSMGAGSSDSMGASSSTSYGSAQDFASSGDIKISRIGEKAPAGMNALSQGEIINIDRTANKVTVRDSRTGSSIRYTIKDQKELKDLNQGDRVQVFGDANQAK